MFHTMLEILGYYYSETLEALTSVCDLHTTEVYFSTVLSEWRIDTMPGPIHTL